MSHADGLALLANGDKYWFEYDGTMDVCCTRIYESCEQMRFNWRGDNMKNCICVTSREYVLNRILVMLSTAYGHWQFLFPSTICIKCMCITGKTHNNDY